MKVRFLALVALVLGLASCQKDTEGFDVAVNGEVSTTVTVNLADASDTRAVVTNSAHSAIANGVVAQEDYTLRYILQVFDKNNAAVAKAMDFKYSDNTSVTFDVRLVPGRPYRFVVWADIVNAAGVVDGVKCKDNHYAIGDDLRYISLNDRENPWVAMDETRDAYTGYADVDNYTSTSPIDLTLTRPFAKLRVVTTDMDELFGNVEPSKATVTYSTKHRTTFDALTQLVGDADTNVTHTFAYADVFAYGDNNDNNKVLFTDYFFAANQDDVVKFVLDVREANDTPIRSTNFNTDIPVKRNFLTTITGNVLTDGNNINVTIEDRFENGTIKDPNYEFKTISSAAEFFEALKTSGQYILISNINLTSAATASKFAATRTDSPKTININLNGLTINVDNQTGAPLVELNDGDALIFSGEGEVTASTNSGKLVDGGTVVVTGAAEVDEDAADAKTGVDALDFICKNGGEFTFTEDLAISEVILVSTTKPVVINGNNKTLTSTATRAIHATVANANIVVNDLNVVVETERVGQNDIRGFSIDDVTNASLTLNNCSVDFTHSSAHDWAYAVNVVGGTNHKVTVNGGTYEGANVINVRGANQTVVVKGAILNCLYLNNDAYFGACIYVMENENSSVYAEGNTFNGNNAWAFNIGYTPLEEKNNTDNTKYVAAKVGGVYYYNIAEAIKAAEDGETVKVLQRHTCTVAATVANGKTLILDLNGKTITGTDSSTGSYALITNKGNLTITGNGKMTLKAENNREWNAYSSVISNTVGGKLVVENGTIEHLGGTDMAYGIDNLTNGKGTYAETVINGGTIKSTYRAVRMFLNGIEAKNLLTVNGGIIEGANKSIWMQDPSANANTGTLVVNEGATLKGDAYLTVTAGSTEWPVEVSIANDAFEGESTLLSSNVPAGYEVVKKGGIWTVVKYTEVASADELVAALEANESVKFKNDIKIDPAAMSNAYGKTGINVNNGQTIDGNGYTLNIKGAGGTWDSGINTTGGLIKNLTVTGSFRGIFINHNNNHSEKVVLDNVTLTGVVYTISCDQGLYQTIEATNCTFNGWTSFAKTAGEAKFVNCYFGEGNGYKFCRPYSNTEFIKCTFCPGYAVDETQATVTFTDCTWEE